MSSSHLFAQYNRQLSTFLWTLSWFCWYHLYLCRSWSDDALMLHSSCFVIWLPVSVCLIQDGSRHSPSQPGRDEGVSVVWSCFGYEKFVHRERQEMGMTQGWMVTAAICCVSELLMKLQVSACRGQSPVIFITQYAEFKYFSLTCQDLGLNQSTTPLNTQIYCFQSAFSF